MLIGEQIAAKDRIHETSTTVQHGTAQNWGIASIFPARARERHPCGGARTRGTSRPVSTVQMFLLDQFVTHNAERRGDSEPS
jgi:hypothetical protein